MSEPNESLYIDFKRLEDGALNEYGEIALNKHSAIVTRGHDFPGAQVGTQTATSKRRRFNDL